MPPVDEQVEQKNDCHLNEPCPPNKELDEMLKDREGAGKEHRLQPGDKEGHEPYLKNRPGRGGAYGEIPENGVENGKRKSPFDPHIDPDGEFNHMPKLKYQQADYRDKPTQGAKVGGRGTLEV